MRGFRTALACQFVLLGALLSSVNCGTPTFIVQQYAGPARAAETIAILRVDGGGKVQLLSLDGEAADARVTPDARLHLELLPGTHTLWVQNLAEEGPAHSVSFHAEASKVYRVEFVSAAFGGPASAHVYEVDRDSNALKADVTLAPAAPPEQDAPKPRTKTPPARILEDSAPASASSDAGAPLDPAEPADAGLPAPTP